MSGDIPTTDFYFRGALADLIAEHSGECGRPIRRLGPFTFASSDRVVIVRYITPAELEIVRSRSWRGVFYVVDDMLPLAQSCNELPADYRERLAAFCRERLPAILDLGPAIVAPSPAILHLFPGLDGHLVDPCRLVPAAEPDRFVHHGAPGPRRIAFLGTRSHAASLDLIGAIADDLGRAMPDARITLFHGRRLPARLLRHPVIDSRPSMPWSQYRRLLTQWRFHVAIAPLRDTPFNSGRSITRILDHAAVGAAGIYSHRAPYACAVRNGESGLLIGDDAGRWCEAVLRLATEPETCRRLAEGGAALAGSRGEPVRLRSFWLQQLGL